MASLYKRVYTKTDQATGRKNRHKSRKWYGKYRDPETRKVERVPLLSDKQAAKAMLNELVRKAEDRAAGRGTPFDDHALRPLTEHLAEFCKNIADKNNTVDYVAKTRQRVGDVLTGCKFKFIRDISASRVEGFLADLRAGGRALAVGNEKLSKRDVSVATSNHVLRAAKMFTRWLVADHRTADDRLSHLEFADDEADRRRTRRSLTSAELAKLVRTAEVSPEFGGLAGRDRAALYVLAATTGLRRNELGSLRLHSFDLSGDPPSVKVTATNTKNRHEADLTLRRDVALYLQTWLPTKGQQGTEKPLWRVTDARTAEMLRADLAAAGIADRDAMGRVVDFHALRTSFVSNLARAGVALAVAQKLARHSTPMLTANAYTVLGVHDHEAAVESMPSITTTEGPESQEIILRATGTDDVVAAEKVVPSVVPCGAQNGAPLVASPLMQSAANCIQTDHEPTITTNTVTPQAAVTCDSNVPHIASLYSIAEAGLEPARRLTLPGILSPVIVAIERIATYRVRSIALIRCHQSCHHST